MCGRFVLLTDLYRAETLTEKPSFRKAFKKQRCRIIADGFYEWAKSGKKSLPHYYFLYE
jgi:putative SOS response-associated peptidase YedK